MCGGADKIVPATTGPVGTYGGANEGTGPRPITFITWAEDINEFILAEKICVNFTISFLA